MADEEFEVTDIQERHQGGQHVGVPYSIIKVLHKPTGIYAVCGTERSQMRSRKVAMEMVEYGLMAIGYRK